MQVHEVHRELFPLETVPEGGLARLQSRIRQREQARRVRRSGTVLLAAALALVAVLVQNQNQTLPQAIVVQDPAWATPTQTAISLSPGAGAELALTPVGATDSVVMVRISRL